MIYKIRKTSVKSKNKGGKSYGPYHCISIALMDADKPFQGAYPGVDEVYRSVDMYSGGTTRRSYFVRVWEIMTNLVEKANTYHWDRSVLLDKINRTTQDL